MALINCPECGREISSTCLNCIHCGCPIEKKQKSNAIINNIKGKINIKCAVIALVILIIITITYLNRGALPFYYYNPTLMKIISLDNAEEVKDILGDDYESKNGWDEYSKKEIDGKMYYQIELSYKSGTYQRIYIESNLSATFTQKDTKNMLSDLCKKYGNEFILDDSPFSGRENYEYEWKLEDSKRVLYEIIEDDEKEGKYYIKLIVFFN